jgi:hypothetical protein
MMMFSYFHLNLFQIILQTEKKNNFFTTLFIKLTMSKMVVSKVFQILQGNDIAEYHVYFNVTFGRMMASTES